MPQRYSFTLAIISVLSALVFGFGLWQLARMLSRKNEVVGELGYVGVVLIVVGNLLNALGRLLSATGGNEAAWMKNSLLFLSAPGFVCLAWALWQASQAGRKASKETTAGSVWLLPLFFNGGLLALTVALKKVKGGQTWLKFLLVITTVASVAAFVQLAQSALKAQRQFVAGLFILSLGMWLAMALRGNDGTEAAEWAQQISNAISQTVFAVAVTQLARIAIGQKPKTLY